MNDTQRAQAREHAENLASLIDDDTADELGAILEPIRAFLERLADGPDLLGALREVEAHIALQYRGQPIGPPPILEQLRATIARAK